MVGACAYAKGHIANLNNYEMFNQQRTSGT